jgi:ABC-type transport system substrate-binding protein
VASCAVGSILNKDCDVTIDTVPATVSFQGTWVSVIYLSGSEVTLVIVGEGTAFVTPYGTLSYERTGDGILDLVVTEREATDEAVIEVPGGQEPLFLYTASDERLAALMEEQELPPPRQALSIRDLPPVRQALQNKDPNLDLWLEQVQEQGNRDGIELVRPATLVTFANGEIQPNLAEGWESSEDGLSWTFHLTPDRRMASGSPYTAEIVHEIFTLQEQAYQHIDNYVGSEVIDDLTIVLLLSKPNREFLQQVATLELPQ